MKRKIPSLTKEELLTHISEERDRQDQKWGKQNHSDEKWCIIMLEEAGEVAQAINLGDTTQAKIELIHLSAVIEAWLTTKRP